MAAYDSSIPFFKSVSGAVAAGQTLRLRVCLPRAFGVFSCVFVIRRDGGYEDFRAMAWEDTDGTDEWWYLDLTLQDPGLYFYRFQYETPWGVSHLGRHKYAFSGDIYGTENWVLNVYDPAFKTPDRFKGRTFYQVFPDRFSRSGQPKVNVPGDRVMHENTLETPVYEPDETGEFRCNDYYGGDLKGITEKLPYLKDLGVGILYLNPVAEAHSNHRYNTADYKKVDPLLGTEEDFKTLCDEAHKLDILVVFDGVYSHTGDDSVYFNRYGRYPNPGAYQSEKSPYYRWYSFGKDRDHYAAWWGIRSLPEVNEEEKSYLDFITGEGGVLDYWFGLGADGVRLDVADELPDDFLDALRTAVKRGGDRLIVGEVWENAVTKISHGGRRRYFDGRQLDGVMNYPFKNAILSFALGGDAERCMYELRETADAYPPEAMHACMNVLGTHDTARVLSVLTGTDYDRKSRVLQAHVYHTEAQLTEAKQRLKLAVTLNFFLPGLPAIYYGDEAGMTGGKDPLNRGFYPWGREDRELVDFYRWIGRIRMAMPVLKDGGFYPLSAAMGCVAYLRYKPGEKRLAVIANRNEEEIEYALNPDMHGMWNVNDDAPVSESVRVPAMTAVILVD
ncbi:MAG: glycoside hydrolase family 13 protein [Clostridia bacterium]|nr:glycoside hydrolase family 13 protein [Clostridia bacterium]